MEQRLEALASGLDERRREHSLRKERLDATLPGRHPYAGHRHPLTVVREELENIFVSMGYEVYDGPEVEDDYHNFEALNIPENHPARDMQDTFYFNKGVLLRTHTSPVQIHYSAGVRRIRRRAHHLPGKGVPPRQRRHPLPDVPADRGARGGRGHPPRPPEGHDRGVPARAVRARSTRFASAASYFPYTEPSVEADLGCVVCGGSGRLPTGSCRICKATGWLEILGSGMVNPAVFEAVNARLGRRRLRPRGGHRVRLRPGHRAGGDGPAPHRRHPAVLRERPPLPGAVRVVEGPALRGCASRWPSRSSRARLA